MPTKPFDMTRSTRLAVFAALAALLQQAQAQTDDTTPFYAGGSLGATHVSNVFRQANSSNSDTVISGGLLGGVDTRLGRQHLKFDGSLNNNRYSTNRELNYRSHTLLGTLNWETAGNLSGVLSAKSDRSLADFNASGVRQIFKKNIETNDEYRAIARLGVGTRYWLESGWTHRRRNFTAWEYDRFIFRQNMGSLGIHATPGSDVQIGVVVRRTKGHNPRYPDGTVVSVDGENRPGTSPDDYTRDDVDFTTRWSLGGHSTLRTRISRSRTQHSLDVRRDMSGTTGAVGLDWRPTAKLQFNLDYARDTAQESVIQATDIDRMYTSWQMGGTYLLTSKISLNARLSENKARRTSESIEVILNRDDAKSQTLGLRWAATRNFSIGCQYNHVSRDRSVVAANYSASSYGCIGQAIVY
ncbi:MAG: hypothetical protein EOP38_03660 [Rubrivivax sp.]|nr:MAG: hypothetical protein EOP38_03660 [Rubrivivax sp.]